MKENKKVGGRIRTYREKLDMSVYDLARRSGVDEKLVNAIEKGEVIPALGVITKISRALGQRLGTFMDDQYKPDPIVTRSQDVAVKTDSVDEYNSRLCFPFAGARQA